MRLAPLLLLAVCGAASAATYEVGGGKPYASLAALPALAAGDVVQISSSLNEVKRWTTAGVTIRGVGAARPVISASGKTVNGVLPNPRAAFQIEASNVVVEHLEFANATNGENGAGVRVTGAGLTGVVVRDCRMRANDMGLMADGFGELLVEGCEIDRNGVPGFAGYCHNVYISGGGSVTFRGCHIHDALYGQNVKSRAHFTALLYNRIADSQDGEVGLVESAATAAAHSNAVMIGNVVISKNRGSGWNNERFVRFGADGASGTHQGTLHVLNNTFIAGSSSNAFLISSLPGSPIVARNNIFVGSARISVGTVGPVSGANNWLPSGATVPAGFTGSVQGAAPGFVSAYGDLHLLAGAAARGIGIAGSTWVDGAGISRSGVPTHTYEGLGNLVARASDGALDAGAYEYAAGGGGGGGGGTISVALTAPAAGSSTAPASFTLAATASDTAGAITAVAFRRDGVLLGTDTSAPYSWTWNGVAAGSYVLTAVATGPSGSATSAGVTVTVTAPAGGPPPPASSSSGGGGCGAGSLAVLALVSLVSAAVRPKLR